MIDLWSCSLLIKHLAIVRNSVWAHKTEGMREPSGVLSLTTCCQLVGCQLRIPKRMNDWLLHFPDRSFGIAYSRALSLGRYIPLKSLLIHLLKENNILMTWFWLWNILALAKTLGGINSLKSITVEKIAYIYKQINLDI